MTQPGDRNTNVVLGADVSGYSAGMAQADRQTRSFMATLDQLSQRASRTQQGLADKLKGVGKGISGGLAAATADAATFEKQLSTLAAKAAVMNQSLGNIRNGIRQTFRDLPVSRGEAVAMTEALEQLGAKGTRSLQKLSETYFKLGAATGEGPVQLAAGMEQLNRQMGGASTDQAAKYANSLLTVSTNAGVAASSVVGFAQDIAPIARAAHISEAAVLGISGAFVKSGQDGRIAANTFNSIMYDIVRNIRMGSPEITKYANLVGTSVQGFKKMSGTDQAISVLTKLGGATGARTLEQWGYEGIRTQAAIAGVTQSGDLQSLVSQAIGSSTNTNNLDKGSAAAFDTLADQLTKFRNILTDAGDSIGAGFLGPVTKLMEGFNSFAGAIADAIHAFAPLVDIVGSLAAGLSTMIGLAAQFASVIGAVVLGRLLMRGTGVAAFGLGRQMARDDFNPANLRGAQARAYERMNSDRGFNRIQTMGFSRGLSMGAQVTNARAAAGTQSNLSGREMLRMGLLAPGRMARWAFDDTRKLTQEAMRDDFQRRGLGYAEGGGWRRAWSNLRTSAQAPLGGQLAGTYGGVGRAWYQNVREYGRAGMQMLGLRNGNAGETFRAARDGRDTGFVRAGLRAAGFRYGAFSRAVAGDTPLGAFRSARDDSRMTGRVNEALRTADLRDAGRQVNGFARGLRTAGMETGAFARGLRSATVATLRQGAGAGAAAIGGVARGAGAALNAAMSPYGMIALTAGTMMYQHYSQKAEEQRAHRDNQDTLTPLKAYDEQLGIATSSMTTFTGAVDQAATKLNGLLANVSAGSTLTGKGAGESGDVRKVSHTDELNAQDAKDDKNITTLRHTLGGATRGQSASALAQLAKTYNFSDRREVQLFKESALKGGFDSATVEQALGQLPTDLTTGRRGIMKFGALGAQLQRDQLDHGMVFGQPDPTNRSIDSSRAAIGGVRMQVSADTEQYGSKYAGLREAANLLSFMSSTASHVRDQHTDVNDPDANRAKRNLLAINLHDAFQTKKSAGDIASMMENTDFGKMTDAQRQKSLIGFVRKAGGNVSTMLGTNGQVDPTKFAQQLAGLSVGTDSPEMRRIRGIGQFGRFVARDNGVVAKGLASPEDPAKYPAALSAMAKAADDAAAAARRGGDKYATAAEQVGKLQQAAGSTTDQLYQAAEAARAMAAARDKYTLPTLSRAGQTQYAASQWVAANRLARSPDATMDQKTSVQAGGAAYTAYHDQRETDRQNMVSLIGQVLEFNKSMRRASEDYQHSMDLQDRQFRISMNRNAEDFRRAQRLNLQDFNRSMRQQSEDTAKSIYDPFARIQPQYVADAKSVEENLREQNQAITQQYADLEKLRNAGVSQQTIDTLNLSDPANAQQTHRMVQDLANDPQLVNQINRSVGQRLAATTQLVHSTFNQTYRRTIDEFRRQTSRAVDEYSRQRSRAFADNTRAVNEMALQHRRQMNRAAQDMRQSLRQITGDVSTLFPQALKLVNDEMSKYAPKLAPIFTREINKIRAAYVGAVNALVPTPGVRPGGTTDANTDPTHGADPNPKRVPQDTSPGEHSNHPTQPRAPHQAPHRAPVHHPAPAPPRAPARPEPPRIQHNALGDGVIGMYYAEPGGHRYAQLHETFAKADLQWWQRHHPHKPIRGLPAHFEGGIMTQPHVGTFAERGAEMAIPLNNRGQDFLAGMYRAIAGQLVSQMHQSAPVMPTGTGCGDITYDYSTEISGPISVTADDPRKLMKELQDAAKLKRLSRPAGRR